MQLNVFQCEGCGNLYQHDPSQGWNLTPISATGLPLAPQPPSPPAPRVPHLGQSWPYQLHLAPDGNYDPARTLYRQLCDDCAAACQSALQQALARR